MGRTARGVRAMDLEEGDYLVGTEVVEKEGLILSISELGFGKRTPLEDYRLTHRGGKGVINMKTTAKTGKVVAILSVKEDSDLMIVTKDGKIIRIESSEIRETGRSAQGVRVVRMEEGDRVAAASVIPEAEPDGDKNGGQRPERPAAPVVRRTGIPACPRVGGVLRGVSCLSEVCSHAHFFSSQNPPSRRRRHTRATVRSCRRNSRPTRRGLRHSQDLSRSRRERALSRRP